MSWKAGIIKHNTESIISVSFEKKYRINKPYQTN